MTFQILFIKRRKKKKNYQDIWQRSVVKPLRSCHLWPSKDFPNLKSSSLHRSRLQDPLNVHPISKILTLHILKVPNDLYLTKICIFLSSKVF